MSARDVGHPKTMMFIGIAVSVICLVIFASQIDLSLTRAMYQNIDPTWLLFGLAALAMGYLLKVFRWRYLLSICGARVGARRCIAPFMGSIALNNLLPLRSGDLTRMFIFPTAIGVSRTMGSATLIVERVVDLWVVLILMIVGLLTLPSESVLPPFLQDPYARATIIALAIIGPAVIIMSSGLVAKVLENRINQSDSDPDGNAINRLLVTGVRTFVGLTKMIAISGTPSRMLLILGLSLICWGLEAGFYLAIAQSMGLGLSWEAGLVLMGASTLATLVPAAPGYFGSFHLAQLATFTMLGVSSDVAGAATVFTHLMLWGSTSVWGLFHLLSNPSLFQFRSTVKSPIEDA